MRKSRTAAVSSVATSPAEVWSGSAVTDAIVWPEKETNFFRKRVAGKRLRETRGEIPSELARAVYILQAQDKFLEKAREALERMQELAILVQQTVRTHRELCLEEFETLVTFLEKLGETEVEGIKLFRGSNLVLNLPGSSDKLVLPAVDLGHVTFQAALGSTIADSASAGKTLGVLADALRFISIARSTTAGNLNRLAFIESRTEHAKQALFPKSRKKHAKS